MWKEDCEISTMKIGEESLRTAKITAKYLDILSKERHKLTKMLEEQNKIVKEKREYYSGQASAEVYKEKPFHLKILKGDLPYYINADEDVIQSNINISKQTEKVEYLKSIITTLNNRRWDIKNYIDHIKFISGE